MSRCLDIRAVTERDLPTAIKMLSAAGLFVKSLEVSARERCSKALRRAFAVPKNFFARFDTREDTGHNKQQV